MTKVAVAGWSDADKEGTATLIRTFTFADWRAALAFVNAVGAIADAHDHHPHVELSWGQVTVQVWSHDVKGLTARDQRFCEAVNALAC
jgi:4a-hydroxytetrahydrobiopterin dehydratase